jgi:hypothetical protein
MTKEELFELTAIDPWWLAQLEELHTTEVRPARQLTCNCVIRMSHNS